MPRPRTGSVFAHGDHFDVQITLPGGKRSRRICLSPSTSEAAAREKAKRWTEDAAAGRLTLASAVAAPAAEGETFEAWTVRWFAARERRGLQAYADAKRLGKWILRGCSLGDRPVAAITRAELEGVVEHLDGAVLSSAMSWKTAINVWGVVSKAFSDAQNAKDRDLRVRDDNPAAGVRGPDRGQSKTKTWLHPREALELLTLDEPLELRRALALNVYLYPRPGELRALLWTDVDFEANRIHIRRVERRDGTTHAIKTKQARAVPIESSLRPLLEAMHAQRSGDRVAPGLPKDTILADVLRAMVKRAGLKRPDLLAGDDSHKAITWYDLRATGITWRAIRGDDPLKIMRAAGHRDLRTTDGYIREAESVGRDFGDVFPPLPLELLGPRIAPGIAPKRPKRSESLWVDRDSKRGEASEGARSAGDREGQSPAERATTAGNPANAGGAERFRSETIDPVEAALAAALERASAAGAWAAVEALARELTARREARAGVVRLDAERARRRPKG